MLRYSVLMFAAAAFAQSTVQIRPDCGPVAFTFTNSQIVAALPPGTLNTVAYRNLPDQSAVCDIWQVKYSMFGLSAATVTFQDAPDTSTGAGTWETFAGTVSQGSNPNTSTTSAFSRFSGVFAWLRVSITGMTCSSPCSIAGIFEGYRSTSRTTGTGNTVISTTCPAGLDQTSVLNTQLATLSSAGGGTLIISGVCRIDGSVVLPNDGASPPSQPAIRITGTGASANGLWTALPHPPSALDLRYDAAVAKIDTRGAGLLEIDHLALIDGGTDCAVFIQTTNTTIKLHDVAFSGTHTGATACNDAVVLGGTTTTVNGLSTGAFQGYGTQVKDNFFDKIRRWVYGRIFVNGVIIRDNTGSTSCGSSDSDGAPIDFDSTIAGTPNVGNIVEGNLLEAPNYTHLVRCTTCALNSFVTNHIYDDQTNWLSAFFLDTSASTYNLVVDGYHPNSKPLVTGDAAPRTTQLASFGGGLLTATPNVSPVTLSGNVVLAPKSSAVIGPAVFTGTGLNDATFAGTYDGSDDGSTSYTVIIDGVGTPNTFKWKKNAGGFTAGVAITGSAQTLTDGVTVTFAALAGHTSGDQWASTFIPTSPLTLTNAAGTVFMRASNVGFVGFGTGTTKPVAPIESDINDSGTTFQNAATQVANSYKNLNGTNNNWTELNFISQANGLAASVAAQNVNHGSSFADLVFATRGSNGFGIRARIPSDGGFKLLTQTAICDQSHEGTMFYTTGTPGVLQLCMKETAGTYGLHTVSFTVTP